MEDLVAIAITLSEGETRYVIAYGRIFDPVDPTELEAVVLKAARRSAAGAMAVRASVCDSLQAAASERFFFEALFEMSRDAVTPGSRRYARWRRRVARSMQEGREIWFLG